MTTPNEVQPKLYSHINGTQSELLDRFAISELCKGWSVYRDASEWANFRSLFDTEAYVWTTWSGKLTIDEFINVSKKGKANGDFIMHRECGTLVDLNQQTNRAVGKMKTTITQRFTQDGIDFDVDCDNYFYFFLHKLPTGEWKHKWYKVIYGKDKLVPCDGHTVPRISKSDLDKYPKGYQYLGWAQEKVAGHPIDLKLPTYGQYQKEMYKAMGKWLEGAEDPGLEWA